MTPPMPAPVGLTTPTNPPAAGAAPVEWTPVEQARARLMASRQRLQAQWMPEGAPGASPAAAQAGAAASPVGLGPLWRRWRRRLLRLPGAAELTLVLDAWWQRHPWRSTANLLTQTVAPPATQAVRRHPLAAVTLAAGVGVLLVVWRPWRSPWCQQRLNRLPAQLGDGLLRLAGELPLQAVLASVLSAAALSGAGQPAPSTTHPEARDVPE